MCETKNYHSFFWFLAFNHIVSWINDYSNFHHIYSNPQSLTLKMTLTPMASPMAARKLTVSITRNRALTTTKLLARSITHMLIKKSNRIKSSRHKLNKKTWTSVHNPYKKNNPSRGHSTPTVHSISSKLQETRGKNSTRTS